MENRPKCEICGEPMPEGEEMFNYHGYSGNCPKPPLKSNPMTQKYIEKIEREFEEFITTTEGTTMSAYMYTKSEKEMRNFLRSSLLGYAEKMKEDVANRLDKYFKGLILIPNPQLTKESLKDYLLSDLLTDQSNNQTK